MKKHLAVGEFALIDHEVQAYAENQKLLLERSSVDHVDLARRMMRAEIEALERTLERDHGDYSGTPKDTIVKPVIGTARERAAPGETISELFNTYARENPKGITADTLASARRDSPRSPISSAAHARFAGSTRRPSASGRHYSSATP